MRSVNSEGALKRSHHRLGGPLANGRPHFAGSGRSKDPTAHGVCQVSLPIYIVLNKHEQANLWPHELVSHLVDIYIVFQTCICIPSVSAACRNRTGAKRTHRKNSRVALQEQVRPEGIPFNEANPSYNADQDIWGRPSDCNSHGIPKMSPP